MIKEQTTEKNDIEYGYQVMYDESNSRLQEQYESIKTLRGISIAFFGFSSLLISLSNPIDLIDPLYPNITCQNLLVIGALIFYLLLIIFCLFVIYPAEMKGPVSPTLEELAKAFGNKTKVEVLKQRVINCLYAIELNEKTLTMRKNLTTFSAFAFILSFVMLMASRCVF